jgi:hypothetical protein
MQGVEIRDIPITSGASIFPAAIKEAKSTRFQISLFLVLALMAGCLYVGREWGRGVSRAEIETIQAKQAKDLELVKERCSACVVGVSNNGSAITTLDGRVQSQTGSLEVVKSKLDDCRRR